MSAEPAKPVKRKRAKRVFVVDRATWVNEARGGQSSLRNTLGNSCCLGFCLLQLGARAGDIEDRAMPADFLADLIYARKTKAARQRAFKMFEGLFVESDVEIDLDNLTGECLKDTGLSNEAARINDKAGLSDPDREAQLSELFERNGYRMRFVGKYPPADTKETRRGE